VVEELAAVSRATPTTARLSMSFSVCSATRVLTVYLTHGLPVPIRSSDLLIN
jgi:hypothetical protein